MLGHTPAWSISVGGAAVGGDLNDRLLSLSVHLYDGHETDSLELRVDDRDFAVAAPETDAEISVSLGYLETGFVFMGVFKVDNVSVHGFPAEMTITAKSADQKSAQKQHRTKPYEKKTLSEIMQEVAGRNGLGLFISPELASIQYPYLHQSEESDRHFATRLGRDHDALVAIKNKMLIFVKRGDSLSASGLSMPQLVIQATDLLGYNASQKDRPKHKKARGAYHDLRFGKAKIVDSITEGQGEANFHRRHLHINKDLAQSAVDAKAAELGRATGSAQIEIIGNPSVQPEGTMILQTGRSVLDGEWLIKSVLHHLTSQGYRTAINGEAPSSGKK